MRQEIAAEVIVTYHIRQKFRQEKIFASGRQWRKNFLSNIFSHCEFRHVEFFVRVQLLEILTRARTRMLTTVSNSLSLSLSLSLSTIKMSIFKYFSTAPRDLPNPIGPLSCKLSSPTIAAANAAVNN